MSRPVDSTSTASSSRGSVPARDSGASGAAPVQQPHASRASRRGLPPLPSHTGNNMNNPSVRPVLVTRVAPAVPRPGSRTEAARAAATSTVTGRAAPTKAPGIPAQFKPNANPEASFAGIGTEDISAMFSHFEGRRRQGYERPNNVSVQAAAPLVTTRFVLGKGPNGRPLLKAASSTSQLKPAAARGHALQTGQLAPVFQQFGLPEETTSAAVSGDILEFAKKLTESEKKPKVDGEAKEEGDDGESSNQNTQQPPDVQTTPENLKGPTPKRGKRSDSDEDQMDLD